MDELVSATQLCERCANVARHCCCSPILGGDDDPRTQWIQADGPSASSGEEGPGTRRTSPTGSGPERVYGRKEPRGHVSFVDEEAEEVPDEPDLADYFGQFQMTRKEVMEFCRAYASHLAKQEAYTKKITAKRVKK